MSQLEHIRRLGKEIDMRTGNVILLILLVLIGFGFLLYYSIDLTRELAQTRNDLAQMQAAMQSLEAQYQALLEENERLNGQVAGLTEQNVALQSQLRTLEDQTDALDEQVQVLQAKLALMEQAHPILAWLASSSPYRLAALFVMPMVPITFGVVYVAAHRKTAGPGAAPATRGAGSQPAVHAALTPEEFQLIMQRRRSAAIRRRAERERMHDRELKG